jgi:hypothetical protein
MGSSIIIDFFRELVNRFFSKSPRFFKVLQVFSACLTFAGYVPSILKRWFGVELPEPTVTLCKDIANYAGMFFLGVMLPVAQKPVAQTDTGEAIKVTDEKKMPFTAKAEAKVMEESVPPPPVKDVPEETIEKPKV